MAGPFDDLIPAQAQSQPPAVIYGDPKPVDPYEAPLAQGRLAADSREAALFPAQARKAEIDADRAASELEKSRIDAERDRRKLAATGGVDPTESERTAAFLGTRVADELKLLGSIKGGEAPGFATEAVRNVLGDSAANYLTGSDRQRVEAAQTNVLDAALTLGTGAAYTKEQLEGYRRSYFPQLGDDAAVILDKQRRLRVLLEAAKVKAGVSAPAIDAALAEVPELTGSQVRNVSEDGLSAAIDPEASEGLEVEVSDDRQPGESEEEYQARIKLGIERGTAVAAGRPLSERSTVNALAAGAADTLTLGLSDEISAGLNTLFSGGTMSDNLRQQRAIDQYDETNQSGARLTGQILGGFGLPVGAARGAAGLARVGAAYGGGYGFGAADGGIGDRLIGAATGASVGAATGGALGYVGSRLTGRGGPNPPGGNSADLIAAANRQGIDPLPADVGGPIVNRFTSGLAQTPFGGSPILTGARRVNDRAGARLGEIAAAEGQPVRQEVLGETAQRAAQRYIEESGQAGRELYRRADELGGDALITGGQAFRNINAQVRELRETGTTSAPVIAGLERLRSDIADDTGLRHLSVDAIRRLRTNVRHEAQVEGLRGTDYQRRAQTVLNDLSEDIARQLPDNAAAAFRLADQEWAERLNVIDDVMEYVIGPSGERSAEAVANRLINMSRGDSRRLRTFVNSVNAEESGVIRGSLIQEMGRAAPGQQGAEGGNFSLQTFLTNWDRTPERTRNLFFRGESRAAIEDLARVAEGARVSNRFSNTSNTGGAANVGSMVTEAGRMMSTGAAISTFGASLALENLTGRLLASPRFARWLARPQEPGRWSRGLARIASREPALAPDIQPILQQLSASVPGRLAAREDQTNRRPEPPQ